MGQLDHSTGSLSEQPPLWWSVRGVLLCGPLQCGINIFYTAKIALMQSVFLQLNSVTATVIAVDIAE